MNQWLAISAIILIGALAQAQETPADRASPYSSALHEAANGDSAKKSEAVSYLLETAWGQKTEVNDRRNILMALGASGLPAAHAAILTSVCDAHPLVSAEAIRTLGGMRFPGDYDELLAIFEARFRHNDQCKAVGGSDPLGKDLRLGLHQSIAVIQALGAYRDTRAVVPLKARAAVAKGGELIEIGHALDKLGSVHFESSMLTGRNRDGVVHVGNSEVRENLGVAR